MFASTLGGQISWLIPFAAIALIATLILIGRRPRTDLARASVLVWGGWFACGILRAQFPAGHSAPVLHQRHGASDRRPDRYRRGRPLPGVPAFRLVEPGAGGGGRSHRRVGLRAAAPDPELERLAALDGRRKPRSWRCSPWRWAGCAAGGPARRGTVRRRAGPSFPDGGQAGAVVRGGRGGRPDRDTGGTGRILGDAPLAGHRGQQPDGRADRTRRLRRLRRGRGRPGGIRWLGRCPRRPWHGRIRGRRARRGRPASR